MRVFSNIEKCYTLQSVADAEGRASHSDALKAIESAVIVEDEGRIVWLGSHKDFEGQKSRLNLSRKTESISLAGTTVLPAFTECHTHLVFAGDRSGEFELRNQGVSYQEISKQGGGILSTVQATCEATESDLLRLAQQRADRFVQQGATALEVKSGYGLSHESEIKMLKVARAIRGPKVMATYLGPHSVPSGSSKTDYLEQILDRTLPEIAKLGVADRADIFIENDFFTVEDGRRYFAKAKELGFSLTAHVEQLSRQGGASMAAQSQALSVDHLVEINSEDIKKLSTAEAPVSVLLPTADFYLKMNYPPARELLDQGAVVALATDFNPGSSPTQSINFVGVLARLIMKMSLSEVVTAYTFAAAKALGLESERGSLSVGKVCDFVCFSEDVTNLFYQVGHHPVHSVYREGCLLWENKNLTQA